MVVSRLMKTLAIGFHSTGVSFLAHSIAEILNTGWGPKLINTLSFFWTVPQENYSAHPRQNTGGRDHNPPVTASEPYAKPPPTNDSTGCQRYIPKTELESGEFVRECFLGSCIHVAASAGGRGPATHDASPPLLLLLPPSPSPPMMHAPHALTNAHTNETGCQSEVGLNSSFLAELVTPLLTEGPYSDLSQIHSFDGENSLVVVEGWETGASDACCRMIQPDPHEGPKREKRNVRES